MLRLYWLCLLLILTTVNKDVVAQSHTFYNASISLENLENNKELQIKSIEWITQELERINSLKSNVFNTHELKRYFFDNILKYKKLLKQRFVNLSKENISGVEYKEVLKEIANIIYVDFLLITKHPNTHNNEQAGNAYRLKGEQNDKGPGDPCQNMDFDNCDYTGWEMFVGDVDTNPYGFINVTPTTSWGNGGNIGHPSLMASGTDQHYIVQAGTDPNAPISMLPPNGGTCAALIGDGTGTGGRAAQIRQTFLVSASNADFSYQYAAVLEDPSGHTLGEKPYFRVRMYDQNGNSIQCGEYNATAGDGSPGWVNTGGLQYKDWSTVIVPLQPYIGQNVTVEVTVGDCSQGGHYGYAYFEASCSPLQIIASDTIVCPGQTVTLNAPSPFNGSYSWSTGATTSSITVSTAGTYWVDLITAPGCSVRLTTTVYQDTIDLVANFVSDTVCLGNATSFTDSSTISSGVISTWQWDFNNDGVLDDSIQNPTYTFPAVGSFPVNLMVQSATGCSDDTTINVVVNDLPTANFSNTIACEGSAISFTDNSTTPAGTITQWNWDFGDGNTATQQNPQHIYTNYGTYNVQLSVSTPEGCADDTIMSVYVPDVPVAAFTATTVCEGDSTVFTDLSSVNNANIATWYWVFGDATSASTQNPAHLYSAAGDYQVTLIVSSSDTLACTDDTTITVTVNPQPVASFSVTDECVYDSVQTTNTSTVSAGNMSFTWNFGDNTPFNTATSPAHQYANPGSYQIILNATNGNCFDSDTNMVTVYAKPLADFTNSPVCFGNSSLFNDNSSIPMVVNGDSITSWSWDVDNNGIIDFSTQSTSYMYPAEGGHNATLIVNTVFGCADTITKPVTVWPLPVVDFSPTEVCLNQATHFNDLTTVSNTYTNNSVIGWQWDFGDSGSAIQQNPVHSFTTPGTYQTQLIATTNNGCVDSITKPVTVNPLPVARFTSSDPSGCSPWCISFVDNSSVSAGNIVQYIWTMGNGDTLYTQNPQYCYTNNSQSLDIYDIGLTVVTDKGCVDDTVAVSYVNIYPVPIADFTYNPSPTDVMDPTISFLDMSIGANQWVWSFGDGDSSIMQNPMHTYADSGNYLVSLYVENQYGCKDSVEKLLRIDPYFIVYIPNTFTPDGDGRNDVFFVKGIGIVEIQYLIFDRWGNRIWEGYTLDSGWDGRYKGSVVQTDTYVYKIKVKDVFDKWHTYIGHVNVIK